MRPNRAVKRSDAAVFALVCAALALSIALEQERERRARWEKRRAARLARDVAGMERQRDLNLLDIDLALAATPVVWEGE